MSVICNYSMNKSIKNLYAQTILQSILNIMIRAAEKPDIEDQRSRTSYKNEACLVIEYTPKCGNQLLFTMSIHEHFLVLMKLKLSY